MAKSNLTPLEEKEVSRIINQKSKNIFVLSQKEMEYVVTKYIKAKKNIDTVIDITKGQNIELMKFFPDLTLNQLAKLNVAYEISCEWFMNKK